jgi:hypothetical protein
MKILFFLAVWKRPEITEICFMGLNRLKRAGLFPVDFLAVISEESMKPLCKKYGIDYVMHENQPLGRKKNFGLTQAFKKDWDYLIELGSDDVLKTELLEVYRPYFDKHEVLLMNNFCYLNSEDLDCRITGGSISYGLGRAISREALERAARGVEVEALEHLMSPGRSTEKGKRGFFPKSTADQMEHIGQARITSGEEYRLWNNDATKGLDNNSNFFLARNGALSKKVMCDLPLAIDIKSDVNIWPFHQGIGKPYPLNLALEGLTYQEQTAIKSLCESKVLESY